MRGGQPPLAPKSSHKVLRSFPPPHRLRGKPLKIPKKPRPPTVIPALATHNNHVTAKLRQKSWQSTTSCHCETFRSWQSSVCTSAMTDLFCHCEERSDVAIHIYIPKCIFTTLVCKSKKKRGNY